MVLLSLSEDEEEEVEEEEQQDEENPITTRTHLVTWLLTNPPTKPLDNPRANLERSDSSGTR